MNLIRELSPGINVTAFVCIYLGEGVKKGGRSVVGVGCSVWGEEDGASLAALCPRMLLVKTDLHVYTGN